MTHFEQKQENWLSQPHLCNDFEAIIWTWLTLELFPFVHSGENMNDTEDYFRIRNILLQINSIYCHFRVNENTENIWEMFTECVESVWAISNVMRYLKLYIPQGSVLVQYMSHWEDY